MSHPVWQAQKAITKAQSVFIIFEEKKEHFEQFGRGRGVSGNKPQLLIIEADRKFVDGKLSERSGQPRRGQETSV